MKINKYYLLKYGFNPEMELFARKIPKETTISSEEYKEIFLKCINKEKSDYIAYSGGIDSDAIYEYIEYKPKIINIKNIDTSYIKEIYSNYKICSPLPDKICQWYQIFLQCKDKSLITGLFHDNLNLEYVEWQYIIKSKNWIKKYLEKFIIFNDNQLMELGYEHKEEIPYANNIELFYDFYLRTSWMRHEAIFELANQMNVHTTSAYLSWMYQNAINKISLKDRKDKKFFKKSIYKKQPKLPSGFYITENNTDLSKFDNYYREFPWMKNYQKYWLYAVEQYEKYQALL